MLNRADAEEHLRVIRSLMERSTHYRTISAQGALCGGILALGAGLWMYRRTTHGGEDCVRCSIAVWLIVLALTSVANFAFLWRDERRRGEPLFSPRLRWALAALSPSFLLAGAGTWPVGNQSLAALGLFWSGLYAVGMLATSHFAPRSIARLGWAFFAATLIALGALYVLPLSIIPADAAAFELYMAATFGVFHIAYALFTWPRGAAASPDV